jgi:hypothetical protein
MTEATRLPLEKAIRFAGKPESHLEGNRFDLEWNTPAAQAAAELPPNRLSIRRGLQRYFRAADRIQAAAKLPASLPL